MSGPYRLASPWLIWALVGAGATIQVLVRVGMNLGVLSHTPGVAIQLAVVWVLIVALALVASRRIDLLSRTLTQHERAHLATLSHLGQLEAQNALLQTIARSNDVKLGFQELARHLVRIVECDRVGLALLKENGREFQTFTARVREEERRRRPRPELEFSVERTLIGSAVRSREPVLVSDTSKVASDFVDANVLHTAGLRSALIVPLVSRNRPVGTVNVVSRARNAFVMEHAEALRPIAEILAVAYVAQQAQIAAERHRTVEAMAEVTLSTATEINSALQTIVGRCEILKHGYPESGLHEDVAVIAAQAQRVASLLDRMRGATQERLRETAAAATGVPSSPEEFAGDDMP